MAKDAKQLQAELSAALTQIEELKAENTALKATASVAKEEVADDVRPPIPSEDARKVKIDKESYMVAPVAFINFEGKRIATGDLLKDKELLKEVAQSGHLLIKKID